MKETWDTSRTTEYTHHNYSSPHAPCGKPFSMSRCRRRGPSPCRFCRSVRKWTDATGADAHQTLLNNDVHACSASPESGIPAGPAQQVLSRHASPRHLLVRSHPRRRAAGRVVVLQVIRRVPCPESAESAFVAREAHLPAAQSRPVRIRTADVHRAPAKSSCSTGDEVPRRYRRHANSCTAIPPVAANSAGS